MIKYIVMSIFVTDFVIDNGTLTTVDYIAEFTIVRVQFLNFTTVKHYVQYCLEDRSRIIIIYTPRPSSLLPKGFDFWLIINVISLLCYSTLIMNVYLENMPSMNLILGNIHVITVASQTFFSTKRWYHG